eukprot:gene4829-3468_t
MIRLTECRAAPLHKSSFLQPTPFSFAGGGDGTPRTPYFYAPPAPTNQTVYYGPNGAFMVVPVATVAGQPGAVPPPPPAHPHPLLQAGFPAPFVPVMQPNGVVAYVPAAPPLSFDSQLDGSSASASAKPIDSLCPSAGITPSQSMTASYVSLAASGSASSSHLLAPTSTWPTELSFSFNQAMLQQPSLLGAETTIRKNDVHTALQKTLRYIPYKGTARTTSGADMERKLQLMGSPPISVFIQMFPCELRDRVEVLNQIIRKVVPSEPVMGIVEGVYPRSETSFIAMIRTDDLWNLVQKLRCRVLMDRHGFWYADTMAQYLEMKTYCESIRRMPQQARHAKTDGLPCMPLVVELSTSEVQSAIKAPAAPPCFDEIAPIQAVERHRAKKLKQITLPRPSEENRAGEVLVHLSQYPPGRQRQCTVDPVIADARLLLVYSASTKDIYIY